MSNESGDDPTARAIAVNCWRGACIGYFARAEASVSKSMDAAFAAGRIKQIRHLAGQRLVDLLKLSEDIPGSAKQLQTFSRTLSHWQTIETKRQFFAHGTVILGSNTNGWIALFDTVDYRGKERTEQRWAVTEAEATEFTDELKHAFES